MGRAIRSVGYRPLDIRRHRRRQFAIMPKNPSQREHAAKIVARLREQYPDAKCALRFGTPLELLVATILSAQCTDVRVNQVTPKLFRKYPDAAAYAHADREELKNDIRSTGFFNAKAAAIQNCCRELCARFGGQVPCDMEALVGLPGVGRKTANVVLGTAFGVASGVVVDTHVARLSRRMGLTTNSQPEKIELDLMELVPREEWIALGHRLIEHGRAVCSARKPLCDRCPLNDLCPKIGVGQNTARGAAEAQRSGGPASKTARRKKPGRKQSSPARSDDTPTIQEATSQKDAPTTNTRTARARKPADRQTVEAKKHRKSATRRPGSGHRRSNKAND